MIDRKILIDAENGNRESMYKVATFYFNNNFFAFAFFWMQKSAKLGYVPAMSELGNYYRKGIGTKVNVKKAHKWLIKASKNDSKNAVNLLVSDYLYGIFKSSPKKALELCQKASKIDSKLGEYYLGLCYIKGIGVRKDIEKARYHFTISAINGFDFAKDELKDKAFSIVV